MDALSCDDHSEILLVKGRAGGLVFAWEVISFNDIGLLAPTSVVSEASLATSLPYPSDVVQGDE